jgi:hypothetical protein
MNEIEALRSRAGVPVALYNKAGALLTRFWARADWRQREEILKTVRWLLNLAKLQATMAPAIASSGKRDPSRRQFQIEAPVRRKARSSAGRVKRS